MNDYFSYENNIIMVDLIVRSTNDLVPLVMKNPELDSTISDTITLILKFLDRILKLLPDVLASQSQYNTKKRNIKIAATNVIETWENFKEDPLEFQLSWGEFHYWWTELQRDLLYIQRSQHTIFLSMN
jgi:hypothetical protein